MLLLTDSTLIYHPGYANDPYRGRDQLERNFRFWFAGEPLQTVLYQPSFKNRRRCAAGFGDLV